MQWSDYWGALGPRQRLGLGIGAAGVLALVVALASWLLRDPYVPLATGLGAERLDQLSRELDRVKLEYRVADHGAAAADALEVPQSQLGKARAALASGSLAMPATAGLELFQETDFSSTDFAQKINYQRALQGELTRTIQSLAGVRSARVHVILPEGGLFRRQAARASAAVSLALQPGRQLARAQVRGIQRLVAASVPEIKVDDVVVLDESGTSLTRPAEADGELSSSQQELKRQADQYLEAKLVRLLGDLVPHGVASLSVDVSLDFKQLRTTTEEPIATRGPRGSEQAAGVLVKERQSQRSRGGASAPAGGDGGDAVDSTDWEYEYKVGHRIEQALSLPGSVTRISAAVALQGAPAGLTSAALEPLLAHAIGLDRARGDSVALLLLPGPVDAPEARGGAASGGVTPIASSPGASSPAAPSGTQTTAWPGVGSPGRWALAFAAAVLALLAGALAWWQSRARSRRRDSGPEAVDLQAVTAQVQQWLEEGATPRVRS